MALISLINFMLLLFDWTISASTISASYFKKLWVQHFPEILGRVSPCNIPWFLDKPIPSMCFAPSTCPWRLNWWKFERFLSWLEADPSRHPQKCGQLSSHPLFNLYCVILTANSTFKSSSWKVYWSNVLNLHLLIKLLQWHNNNPTRPQYDLNECRGASFHVFTLLNR